MSDLKVVALISGGKDSLFSILHCQANGHDVVALANLHPEDDAVADTESYMYQTVGHAVIPLYETALGLPLYRQPIIGSVIDQNKTYGPQAPEYSKSSPDEVESMFTLLQRVKQSQPEVNAVCTGAILSDYQRTRVESIALRLGLTPLSYLWQFPFLPPYLETSLLDDMTAVGQDSRIIKVASGGLDESSLWRNVADAQTKQHLLRAMSRFGEGSIGSALGEGGEFETLALDGPAPLWKVRIHIADEDRMLATGDAGSAAIAIKTAEVVPKTDPSELSEVRRPPIFDDKFTTIRHDVCGRMESTLPAHVDTATHADAAEEQPIIKGSWVERSSSDNNHSVLNMIGEGEDASAQMNHIMDSLIHAKMQIDPQHIIFSTILLASMDDFAEVNAVYGSYFKHPSPPARVTIACPDLNRLSTFSNTKVVLSVVYVDREAVTRKQGLHVQSRSYWAPANIGPYSQAVTVPQVSSVDSLVYIAGQIPLVPASMDFSLPSKSLNDKIAAQTTLALQHLWRIGQVMNVNIFLGGTAFLSCKAVEESLTWIRAALDAWKLAHQPPSDQEEDSDEEAVDVWDLTHGRHSMQHNLPVKGTSTYRQCIQTKIVPPCFVCEVESLPRDAPIEFASTGLQCAGECTLEGTLDPHHDNASQTDIADMSTASYGHKVMVLPGNDGRRWGWLSFEQSHEMARFFEENNDIQRAVLSVYITRAVPGRMVAKLQAQMIPCHRVWDWDRRAVAAVVFYQF
ncbi:hypothetical protein MBLNU457_1902t3 [Dothideomycetes sp. NU457]